MINIISSNISSDFWDIKGPGHYEYNKEKPAVFPDDDNDDEDGHPKYDDGDDD